MMSAAGGAWKEARVLESGKAGEEDEIVVRFVGFPVQMVNAIRRSTQRDVPSCAVDEVTISENGTCFWDEYIAHRVGLVPLEMEEGRWEEGAGEGRPALSLDVQNDGMEPLTVFSSSFVCSGGVRPQAGTVPIVLLGSGDRLSLSATATRGTGARHARFVPCVCFYREEEGHIDLHIQSTGARRPASILRDALAAVASRVGEARRKADAQLL